MKTNGFSSAPYRASFSAFPTSRSRVPPPSLSTFRDSNNNHNSNFFPPTNDGGYPPRMTSPTHAMQFDSRASYDIATTQTVKSPYAITEFPPGVLSSHTINKPAPSQMGSFQSYGPSLPMSSQTPYGPHLASGAGSVNGPLVTSAPVHPTPNMVAPEEISTIFVVGFPEDMQEREFQNMFTFSPGFEAATLKIPNKELTSYGGPGGHPVRSQTIDPFTGASAPTPIDSRDAPWQLEDQFAGVNAAAGSAAHQRKQIIGFAKFRTREQAVAARDVLQGKRVDVDKGAVLKAEMAKKNLHTKRGNAPAIPIIGGVPGVIHSMVPSETVVQPLPQNGPSMDINGKKEKEYTLSGWAAPSQTLSDYACEEEEREKRQRDAGVISAMGLASVQRGARVRAEEHDRERRKEKEKQRAAAFDAFHSVASRSAVDGSMFSPTTLGGSASLLSSDTNMPPSSLADIPEAQDKHTSAVASDILPTRALSPTSRTRQNTSFFQPSSHTPTGHSLNAHMGIGSVDKELIAAVNNLAVSTTNGATSPQLSSPESGGSATSATKASVDQNPPINTLYVGNLPATHPPPGFPQDHLEEALRELFSSQPGYRRLCFKMKNNGPMCFAEFEDVAFATRALNDLYGNTLNGLIKGGGIRLSYSKNPLGVRTPTSAGSTGSVLQQQQQQTKADGQSADAFQIRHLQMDGLPTSQRRDTLSLSSPPPSLASLTNFMSSPPPRFVNSPPGHSFNNGSIPANTGPSNSFLSRCANPYSGGLSNGTFSPFGVPSSAPLSPTMIPDHISSHDHLFSLRDQQQPTSQHHFGLEVSRAS